LQITKEAPMALTQTIGASFVDYYISSDH